MRRMARFCTPTVTSARATDMALPIEQRTLPELEGVLPLGPSRAITVASVAGQTQRRWRPGWGAAAVLLLLSALLLSVVAAGPNTLGLDLRITHAVQSLDSGLPLHIAALGNALGSTAGIASVALALGVVLAASRRWWDVALVAAALCLTRANWLLKHAFSSPRPSAAEVDVRDPATFYGFPSGHTSATVLLVGVALVLLWPLLRSMRLRAAASVVGGVVVIGVGFARVFSGAHWPSDVLGGVLWGVLGVWALVTLRLAVQRRAQSRMRRTSMTMAARRATQAL